MKKSTIDTNLPRITTGLCLVVVVCFFSCTRRSASTAIPSDVQQQLQSLNDSGKKARENSRFAEAIELHHKALRLAEEVGDTSGMIRALNNIGTNYRRLGVLDEASRFHFEALSYCMQQAGDTAQATIKNRLISLNGIGNIYMTLGNYEQADSIFRVAMEGERQLGSLIGQAINLANLGSVKEATGQVDSAWAYFRYSLALNRQAHSNLGISLCYSHFGQLHEKAGDNEAALAQYMEAYQLMADSPDDWHRLESGLHVVRLYITEGRTSEALQLLDKGLETAERIGSIDHLSQIHNYYYQLYQRLGDTPKALYHYIEGDRLRDSLVSVKKVNEIQNLRIKLEHEQQQTAISQAHQLYHSEKQVKDNLILILVILVVLAIAIIGALWYTLRERSKTHRILQQMQKSREDFFASIAIEPEQMSSTETIIDERDRQFIGRFVDVVYTQMAQGKTDVETVAQQLGMSRTQMNRRLLAITGQNASGYITQIRISKAKRLLRSNIDTPIGDIAAKCGYDDVAYFSRIFKQQTNMTPSQYRKMV